MAETKKSVVKSVDFKKSATGNYGEVHYYAVAFENGDKGSYGSKKNPQTYFEVNKEAEYEISTNDQGFVNIKPVRAAGGGFGGVRENVKAANARQALQTAGILVAAGKAVDSDGNKMTTIQTAEKLLIWLNKKSD